jgi:hypothetical protein
VHGRGCDADNFGDLPLGAALHTQVEDLSTPRTCRHTPG